MAKNKVKFVWNPHSEDRIVLTMSPETFYKMMKEEGKRVDPQNARVIEKYIQAPDAYGLGLRVPKKCSAVGRASFASNPEGTWWVLFQDLPETTRRILKKRRESGEFDDDGSWLFDEPDWKEPNTLMRPFGTYNLD